MISRLYRHSNSQAKPLRIGVMVDGFELSRAFRQVLTDIQESDFATLEVLIVNRQQAAASTLPPRRFQRYLRLLTDNRRRPLLLFSLFQRLDQKVEKPDPQEDVDCTDILGGLPRLDVVPIAKGFVHRFPPEAITAVRSYDLDVILRFGFNILRGEVLTIAKNGVWSFHHGDNDFYRGGPALFWEVVENNPSSGVILQVLTDKLDDGVVLCKSLYATVPGLWPSRNWFAPYWGSTHFVIRKLHQLHESGWEAVKRQVVPMAPYQGKTAIYRRPTNSQMVKWLMPEFAGILVRRLNPFRGGKLLHWRICLRRSDSPRLLADASSDKSGFRWIPSPPGRFYADPFLFEHQGQVWLFFEDYSYGEKRGVISCAPIQSDLSIGATTVCLDLPYHLSYPMVFSHGGEIFMIPESVDNQSIELWRATDFPFSWKLEKTLFKGSFVDTTPLFHNGRWYFFTTIDEPLGSAAFGALFSSDTLTGDWVHHPSSPISTDVRYARSAGAIVNVEGRLLRPVQDCAETYGRRIHVEEILELTPTTYRSRRLHSIEPDWEKGLRGTHTYAFSNGIEILDAVAIQDRRNVMR